MNILITGCSRGIGRETAKALALSPENKVIVLSRNTSRLESLANETPFNNIRTLSVDLTNFDITALNDVLADVNALDVLINNASLLISKPFDQLSIDDWKEVFDINLFGTVRLIQAMLPRLKKSKSAHILNISSMGGVQGSSKFPGLCAYSASKAAIINLTECLAEELKETAIKVNALALGAVQTEMLEEAFPGYQAPVTSEQMADYIRWFAINGHRFHNGKTLPVAISTP